MPLRFGAIQAKDRQVQARMVAAVRTLATRFGLAEYENALAGAAKIRDGESYAIRQREIAADMLEEIVRRAEEERQVAGQIAEAAATVASPETGKRRQPRGLM